MADAWFVTGALLVLASIPLPFQKPVLLSTVYPCDIVFPAIAAGWLLWAFVKGRRWLRGKKVVACFMPFFFACLISGFNAKDTFRYAGYLYLWAQIPLAYFMVVNIIRTRRHLDTIVLAMLIIAAVFSLSYILISVFSAAKDQAIGRLCGNFGIFAFFHKNIAAGYIGTVLPLYIGSLFLYQRPAVKAVLSVLFSISLLAMVCTGSRWGLCSSGLGLLVFICVPLIKKAAKKIGAVSSVVCLFLLMLAFYLFVVKQNPPGRLAFHFDTGTFFWRLNVYKLAFLFFCQHPLTGIGVGNFMNVAQGALYGPLVHPHSMPVEILVETGILGFATFGYLLWKIVKRLFEALRSCKDRTRYVRWAAVASLLFFLTDNIFDFTLAHGIGIQIGAILALVDCDIRGEGGAIPGSRS